MKNIGKYCIIEGPDGSGKTSIAKALSEEHFNLPTKLIREPGGTPFGEDVRTLFRTHPNLPAAVKFNLMFAARAMLRSVIEQGLASEHIISDRGFPSTYAYQIRGEITPELEQAFWELLFSDMIAAPDFIVILDVSIAVGDKRMQSARHDVGIKEFDEADSAFKQRVHHGYQEFHHKWLHRSWTTAAQREMEQHGGILATIPIHRVDANQSFAVVYDEVRTIVTDEFKR